MLREHANEFRFGNFCLYVDDGRFSFSQNQILCEGAPGTTGITPVGPTTRPNAGKKKEEKEGKEKNRVELHLPFTVNDFIMQ